MVPLWEASLVVPHQILHLIQDTLVVHPLLLMILMVEDFPLRVGHPLEDSHLKEDHPLGDSLHKVNRQDQDCHLE